MSLPACSKGADALVTDALGADASKRRSNFFARRNIVTPTLGGVGSYSVGFFDIGSFDIGSCIFGPRTLSSCES